MTRRHDDCPSRPIFRPFLTLLALFVSCAVPLAAWAKTFKLGDEKPIVELVIPPDWETVSAETGVEATTPGIYLSAEVIDADDLAGALAASTRFLAERKIQLKQATKSQKLTKVAGLPAAQNDWEGTDPDGPTRVRITLVTVAKDKLLLVFYWRSEAGEKAHAPEIAYIYDSVKPIAADK